MSNLEGILGRVVAEKRAIFEKRFHAALIVKYGDVKKYPRGELAAMAKACKVKPGMVYLWRDSETFPSDEHIEKLAGFFGLSVEKFLGKDLFPYWKGKDSE